MGVRVISRSAKWRARARQLSAPLAFTANATYALTKYNTSRYPTNGVYRYGDIAGESPGLKLTTNLTNQSAAGAALDLSTR